MERISQLQIKDVICINSGRRLGYINDIEINIETGFIEALIINNRNQFMSFFSRDDEIIISWDEIVKIGEDVIVVDFSS